MALGTLVIGGGIGGLSLARELVRRALPVTVLERTASPAPAGAGIIMNPNAMHVLERNGLAEAVRARGRPYLAREPTISGAGGSRRATTGRTTRRGGGRAARPAPPRPP